MITSLSNERVKLVRALARRRVRWRERCFLLEGVRLLGEAARIEPPLKFVMHTEASQQMADVGPLLHLLGERGIACYLVSDEVMAACSATVAPPGVLAVAPFPKVPPPERPTWTVLVDGVRTPGNLGAVLRTAAAAGVDQVLLSPGTVDLYNPKVVRGGAGAHFRLSILPLSWQEVEVRLEGLDVWLAAPQGDLSYTAVDWLRPLALIVGGEAQGASQAVYALAHKRVTIPMEREVDSLNVAVAAGVLLFEIARQRRAVGRTLQ
jgi:TrmH family RNA methyltransferase